MAGHARRIPYTVGEEIAHVITHGLGLVLSVVGAVVLVVAAALHGDAWHITGCGIFGATLVLVYATSTVYHGARAPRTKAILRRFDHSAIYLLIAGTYTPFTLVSLRGGWGWTLLALVWGMALLGIALEVTLRERAIRYSLPLYLAMGWLGVIALEPLTRSLGSDGLLLLVLGGLAYGVGVVFFAWQRIPYNHAVWHLCVLGGSAFHFYCVLGYVIPGAG